jgi:hypothetical protein
MIASFPITVYPVFAYNELQVGVKKGDSMEYNITITGPPLDSARNLIWFRNEILDVQGNSFKTNMTSRSVNGTVLSSLWDFNLNDGQVCGWVIIPSNLSTGEQFFDVAKGANITIEGQEQKIIAGASRTITHATDPGKLYKEWDKATGVYVNSIEHTKNYTVITNATTTNLWNAQINEPNQAGSHMILTVILLAVIATILIFMQANCGELKNTLFQNFQKEKSQQ